MSRRGNLVPFKKNSDTTAGAALPPPALHGGPHPAIRATFPRGEGFCQAARPPFLLMSAYFSFSKSAAPCLHRGQMKSAGRSSPSYT